LQNVGERHAHSLIDFRVMSNPNGNAGIGEKAARFTAWFVPGNVRSPVSHE
jgi:hypothetical protein